MDINLFLYILAVICFGLDAFGVPRLNWTAAGFALVTLATFVV